MDDLNIEKLNESIQLLTKAIDYYARVIGYKADGENPAGADGKSTVKLEHIEALPAADMPMVVLTIDAVRDALNVYAQKHGKEKTFAALKPFAATLNPSDIPVHQYKELIDKLRCN